MEESSLAWSSATHSIQERCPLEERNRVRTTHYHDLFFSPFCLFLATPILLLTCFSLAGALADLDQLEGSQNLRSQLSTANS
ncbi:auxin transport protein BIG-like protein [Corchorus olitorius]|uniref:Auxin transport protein BIG-like protein n=1 Tax=Corchorus olitorius TaxID=93759 RepID=A0A1R3KSB8_9ROSI|nr:auxin transport protein BIG-like protein [Corchorus olitorius]